MNTKLILIGLKGSGKSTISDQLSFLLGTLDENLMQDIVRQLTESNISEINFALLSEKLRATIDRCATVSSKFMTSKYKGTLLDTPTYDDCLKDIIDAALQADHAIVNVDSSFQDSEDSSTLMIYHASVIHALGVKKLICTVNKMDATSPPFSKTKFIEVKDKIESLLVSLGFSPENLHTIPVSALYGENVTKKSIFFHWFNDSTLLEAINSMEMENRSLLPLRIPIKGQRDVIGLGILPYGCVESGILKRAMDITFPPSARAGKVQIIEKDSEIVSEAVPGELAAFQVKDVRSSDILPGLVASDSQFNATCAEEITAQVLVLKHPLHIKEGFKAVLHCHTSHATATFSSLIAKVNQGSGITIENSPKFLVGGDAATVKLVLDQCIVLETFDQFQNLGRFLLKKEDEIVAVGVIKSVQMISTPIAWASQN